MTSQWTLCKVATQRLKCQTKISYFWVFLDFLLIYNVTNIKNEMKIFFSWLVSQNREGFCLKMKNKSKGKKNFSSEEQSFFSASCSSLNEYFNPRSKHSINSNFFCYTTSVLCHCTAIAWTTEKEMSKWWKYTFYHSFFVFSTMQTQSNSEAFK